jgi:exopolysaccharide biosynthesis polyprenyl glycosylphosphotransferase
MNHSRWGFEPLGYLDDSPAKQGQRIEGLQVLGTTAQLKQVVERAGADEVWIALPARAHERLEQVVAALERHPVRIKVVPDYFSLALVRAEAEILGGMPIIGLRDPLIEGFPRLLKRLFDVAVTLLLLIPTGPLMGAIALWIRLDSGAPSVLRQERVGENGRLFSMFKFRTMRSDAGEEAAPQDGAPHKRRDDPRVTRAGRALRRYSLDELPQFFNVLKGDMSLVGPRPEMPWLVDRYESWQRKRFAVPQGLTGWWQINGRSDRPMHLSTEDDLYYVYNYSPWLDILILLRTPPAVLSGKGAF